MPVVDYLRAQEEAEALLVKAFALDDLADIDLPVDIPAVVKYQSVNLIMADLIDGVSGAYSRSDNTIYIDQNEPLPRKLFTIAHELGHSVLHEDMKEDVLMRAELFSNTDDYREKEANRFAACLLMPEKMVRRLWKDFPDVEYISRRFNVSVPAMTVRLKSLKLIPQGC